MSEDKKIIYVIHLDENGKETNRKVKGRGKPPKERDTDGNYIVRAKPASTGERKPHRVREVIVNQPPDEPNESQGQPVAEVSIEQVATSQEESLTEAEGDFKPVRKRIKTDIEYIPFDPEKVLANCLPLRVKHTENETIIEGPMIIGDTGIPDILQRSGVYGKIVMTKTPKELHLWKPTNSSDTPNVIVREEE